jgi:hypothetical protein
MIFLRPHNQCFKIHFKIVLQSQLWSQNGLSLSGRLTEMYAFLISPVRVILHPILSSFISSAWEYKVKSTTCEFPRYVIAYISCHFIYFR